MRLQEILKEDLEWGPGLDKDVYMSLKGLVNKNDGVYKSRKQKWFIENRLIGSEPDRDRGFVKDNFGADVGDGEKFISVEALARWAKYGSRSLVPVRWGFVMDSIGVAKFYKIGNKGNLRDGASPDPSKTKLEWERPANVDASHLEKSEEEKKKEFKVALGMSEGDYIGTEGERMKFELTLVAKKYLDTTQVSYNVSAEKWWNMYEDKDGNVVYHTGKEGPEKGEKVVGAATVKKHLVNKKGQKVTVVIRPRFKLVENMKVEEITESMHRRSVRDIYNQIRGEYYVWGEDFVGDDNFELTIEEAGEKYKIFVDSTIIKVEPRFRNKQTHRRAKEIEQELST